MPGAIHDSLVLDLVKNHGCQKSGWNVRRLASLIAPHEPDSIDVPACRPDAFRIDSDARTIVCFEVEVDHPLSEVQLRRYASLWFHMDCEDWDLGLVAVSRHGAWTQVALPDLYLRLLAYDVVQDQKKVA